MRGCCDQRARVGYAGAPVVRRQSHGGLTMHLHAPCSPPSSRCSLPLRRRRQPVPVLFDTDIGTDIDDAYALALILRSPELELLGVTTVSGDAVARARLAAKLLAIEGGAAARVPVYAGTSTRDAVHEAGGLGRRLHVAGAAHRRRRRLHAPADRSAARRAHHHRGRRADQHRGAADVVTRHRRQDQAHRADGRGGAAAAGSPARRRSRSGTSSRTPRRRARCSPPACR